MTSPAKPSRTITHVWRAGDLVIWDNRCILHRGQVSPDDQARVMARTTVAGEVDGNGGNEWNL
ncbi:MAG: TauD/TfdA family dioxygenase [Alphaproteobacteria bacterium]